MNFKPLPPDVLVTALQDRIHATSGRLRAAKAIRMPKTSPPEERPAMSAADTQPLDASAVHRTPDQWAEFFYPASDKGRMHADRWKHAAADALHGWSAHRALTGQSVMFSQSIYLAAVEAASGNTFVPHGPADKRSKG